MIIIKHWFPSNHRLRCNVKQLKISSIKGVLENLLDFSNLDPKTTIGVYIATARQIAGLSRYKGKRHSTDTLSFPYHDPLTSELQSTEFEQEEDESKWCLGEIILCPERIIRGRITSISQNIRLRTLLIHSFVHLLGYDHQTKSEYLQMRVVERSLLNQLLVIKGHKTEQIIGFKKKNDIDSELTI
jgi:probable rRNA maturation factor